MTVPGAADPSAQPAVARCAAHPTRPAVDTSPVCGRPRCGADAADGPGCSLCAGARSAPARRGPTDLERLVRAALAATAVALLGGVVSAQYVGAELFAYLTPLVVGVACGAATQAAAGGPRRGRTAQGVRAVAAAYAVLGVALGFVLERSGSALAAGALVPYAAAVLGALLWTLPPAAPKRR